MLALGRRPLRQEHARPDPPTAGGRPRQRGVGAGARRAHARPRGAHPDRDPAVADALRPGRSQPARGARVDGRARPPGAGSQAHRGHRQAPLERERAAAKAARAAPGAGQAPVRKGLSPEAVAAIREVVEGRPRAPERAVTSAPVDPWNPAESHLSQLIPLNPGESRPENVSPVSRPGPTPFESLGPDACTPAHLPLAPSLVFKSLNGGREVNHFPQRRARAPLACLRAIRRGAQSRAPDLRSGLLHGEHLLSRRARDPMCSARDLSGAGDFRPARLGASLPGGGGGV